MMSGMFDKNGNATETHIATVHGFDSENREFTGTYDVRIFAGTGIPGHSTLTKPPVAKTGHAVCWDGAAWQQVIDLRGNTAYETKTGAAVAVKNLGPLAAGLTIQAPTTPYDKWDGEKWVTDAAAVQAAAKAAAEQKRAGLLSTANNEIVWRQDAVDADIATDDEKTALAAWKKYRVLLMRVDLLKPEWPPVPES